jgi:uncharacterized membrane protein
MAIGPVPGATRSFQPRISADGSTVVGISDGPSPIRLSFRWSGTIAPILSPTPIYGPYCEAADVSGDGSTVVGTFGDFSVFPPVTKAYLWTAPTGAVQLADPENSAAIQPNAISADGSTIVGWRGVSIVTHSAFRRTRTGFIPIPAPGGGVARSADYVSADGMVVVGTESDKVYRWTEQTGVSQTLGTAQGFTSSTATGMSSGGNVIVGYGFQGGVDKLFKWSLTTGMTGITATLPTATAMAISDDGTHMYGIADQGPIWQAWVWDTQHGMRNLASVLETENNYDLTGWKIYDVTDVSADGMVLTGEGVDPLGRFTAWVAYVPEPGGASIVAGLMTGILLRRRTKKPDRHGKRPN